MEFVDVSVPEIYKSSADFRFFLRWFIDSLERIHHDTENLPDIYDPLRCPPELLWMLADTMGFKFDDRLPIAFNRLVLVYFMSMIRNKGSKDGVTLAAETNLAQFNILDYGKEKDILYNRLEDTSIPVNAVSVTPHTPEGFIEVTYFSDKVPIDACIEYVRPLGMYLIQRAGVRYDARTKISIDAKLTDLDNLGMSIGPTHIGHYSREDYARMQKVSDPEDLAILEDDPRNSYYDPESTKTRREQYQDLIRLKFTDSETCQIDRQPLEHKRQPVYYRNSKYEESVDSSIGKSINPGYRSLYSIQLCNNDHIVRSLMKPIFELGLHPLKEEDVSIYDADINGKAEVGVPLYNLRYDREREESMSKDVYTLEASRTDVFENKHVMPRPAVNPVMTKIGDALSMNPKNSEYVLDAGSGLKLYAITQDGEIDHQIVTKDEVDDGSTPV